MVGKGQGLHTCTFTCGATSDLFKHQSRTVLGHTPAESGAARRDLARSWLAPRSSAFWNSRGELLPKSVLRTLWLQGFSSLPRNADAQLGPLTAENFFNSKSGQLFNLDIQWRPAAQGRGAGEGKEENIAEYSVTTQIL